MLVVPGRCALALRLPGAEVQLVAADLARGKDEEVPPVAQGTARVGHPERLSSHGDGTGLKRQVEDRATQQNRP